ncbi:sensor histidine kinase [Nonomuraea sp. SBT364]|uniref:sensor histidine kinase n=1 Tax=Nonomuraea sp. SBT364 TaxID=1580530 RepID=UPI00066DB6C5|nr:histidine kinase [Nonomuraea sp. SBT364]
MRRATKLDKIRWIVVYSCDLSLLLALIGLIDLHAQWQNGVPAVPAAAGAVLLVSLVVMTSRAVRIAVRGGARPTALLTMGTVCVLLLTAFPLIWAPPVWLALIGPYVRRRTLAVLALVSLAVPSVYVTVAYEFVPALLAVQAAFSVLLGGGVLANLWLWGIAREAHEGQEAKAMLAVSEERLRFARDLNDLLGQSLTGIAARTAGAQERLPDSPEDAARVMFEVRDGARQALREVRATVQNYRALDFEEVLASVRAVLEAADVRCTVDADTGDLAPETRTLLATVVREGATNVLKHSRAEQCTIMIREGILEMSNDGVSGPVGEHAPNGLGGLAQRVAAAGGSLSASPTLEGAYLLRVEVPA